MTITNLRGAALRFLLSGTIYLLLAVAFQARAYEARFKMLHIGTRSFTNATVTTNASFVFIAHQGGLENLKLAHVTPEVRELLGYTLPTPKTNLVASWTKSQVSKLNAEEFGKIRHNLQESLSPARLRSLRPGPAEISLAATLMLLCYAFFSYCCHLICTKAGINPGPAIWFPVLQLFPLVRAARMAPAWGLAFLIPVLNIVALVIWSFKIAQARSKGPFVAVLLVLPFTNLLAFLYLAFSAAAVVPQEPKPRAPQIMTLETA